MGGALKDATNPFFKSNYADLASVTKAIKQAFSDNGLSYVQFPAAHSNKIGITTRLMHESGEWMEQSFLIPYQQIDPQKAGSVLTYFRRYALASVAGVPQVDDDAEMAMARNEPEPADYSEEFNALTAIMAKGDPIAVMHYMNDLSEEAQTEVFNYAPQGQKTKFKERVRGEYKKARELVKQGVDALNTAMAENSAEAASEALSEMSAGERELVMSALDDVLARWVNQVGEAA
jgi:hypothetical protein